MAAGYLINSVDFGSLTRVLDVGGGDATIAVAVAQAFPHLQITVLELPGVVPLAQRRVDEAGVSDRVQVIATDMFAEPFPPGHDGALFVHQLQIWPLDQDTELLRRAHEALPPGGSVVIMNSMSDDTGDGPLMAALDAAYFRGDPGRRGHDLRLAQVRGVPARGRLRHHRANPSGRRVDAARGHRRQEVAAGRCPHSAGCTTIALPTASRTAWQPASLSATATAWASRHSHPVRPGGNFRC